MAGGDVAVNVISVGAGPPVVLVPGWPQSGFAWRFVAPMLAATARRVHVVEPRGLGASDKPVSGYDLDTAAEDLARVIEQVAGGEPVDLVAHDIGAWISHAHHERHYGQLRSLTLIDAAIPGVSPPLEGVPDDATNMRTWHFAFNRLPELPELLVAGREREFLAWLFASKAVQDVFDDVAIDEYVRVLRAPGALTAGFAYYREVLSDTGRVRASERAAVPMRRPVLTVGGSCGVGDMLGRALAPVAERLRGVVLLDTGHYVPEERPVELVRTLDRFWAELDG